MPDEPRIFELKTCEINYLPSTTASTLLIAAVLSTSNGSPKSDKQKPQEETENELHSRATSHQSQLTCLGGSREPPFISTSIGSSNTALEIPRDQHFLSARRFNQAIKFQQIIEFKLS